IISLSDQFALIAFELTASLRRNGFKVELGFSSKSLKTQLKSANKSGAQLALIIGEDEWKDHQVTVKNMSDGSQTRVEWQELIEQISELITPQGVINE
ncbi:MAG TPA: hypothetical protein DDZ91_02260, partial [Firmicutes bacterium]|nr:hypothetical protein [Bacillota bacterium]